MQGKCLGQYSTPDTVARAMAEWCVHGVDDPVVFEPGFGGCAFLLAVMEALRKEKIPDSARRIFGVDIDPSSREHLEPLLRAGADPSQFRIADFFDVTRSSFPVNGFSAVIGNPPYVRHHSLDKSLLANAYAKVGGNGTPISRRASYWAYFVLHSLDFLRPGGRLALVLPEAFLFADYAQVVRREVFTGFRNVFILLARNRLFPAALESGLVLLASGWGERGGSVEITVSDQMDNLVRLHDVQTATLSGLRNARLGEAPLSYLLDPGVRELYSALAARPDVIKLGDKVRVRIGVVTGANDYFIVGGDLVSEDASVTDFVVPIICHWRWLRGLEFVRDDLQDLVSSNVRCHLLAIPAGRKIPHGLRPYLKQAIALGINKRYKCRTRRPWYTVQEVYAPEAFLAYMVDDAPRIVLNTTTATCTNAIHRLSSDSKLERNDWFRLALGSLTSLFQLSAELVGRNYGGGVLKLEPSEAARLVVPFPRCESNLPEVFRSADMLFRCGRSGDATALADKEVLVKGMGMTWLQVDMLRRGRDCLRTRRLRRSPTPARTLPGELEHPADQARC